jgi:hypothetical protein
MSERFDHCATRHNEAPQKDRKVVQDALNDMSIIISLDFQLFYHFYLFGGWDN